MSLQIQIGTLTIGDNSQYKLLQTITGLGMPPIRMGSGKFGGRDGGYVSSQYFDMRIINVPGHYIGTSILDAQNLRNALNSIPIRQLLPITITFNNQVLYTEGYINSLNNDLTNDEHGAFNIQIVCPDPYLYDYSNGPITQEFYKVSGGGYITPYSLPVNWYPGSTPAQVNNTGDIYIYPTITLVGVFTNPRIINQTTGAFIELSVVTAGSDTIIIDMKNRTITLDGGSVASYRTDDSTWWFLQPGVNVIVLESDSSNDEDTGSISYLPGTVGI